MLVKTDYTGKSKSIYACDRCKKELHTEEDNRFRVDIRKNNKMIKKWDLCIKCYSALYRGIEKGVKKDGEC